MGLVSLTGGLVWQVSNDELATVELARNFYGGLALQEHDVDGPMHRLSLTHGRIRHGSQLQLFPSWPTEYYGPETGVALAIQHHPNRPDTTRQFRVGVVGLGVGTIAAYANTRVDAALGDESYVTVREAGEPDYTRFYELNPLVTRWATDRFTFVRDAEARGADVAVFQGDARIVLERQLEQGEAQRFDVLAIDAFSSDRDPSSPPDPGKHADVPCSPSRGRHPGLERDQPLRRPAPDRTAPRRRHRSERDLR